MLFFVKVNIIVMTLYRPEFELNILFQFAVFYLGVVYTFGFHFPGMRIR